MRVAKFVLAALAFAAAIPALGQTYPVSGAGVRAAIKAELDSGDDAAVTRHALELAQMGGSVSEATWQLILPHLDAALLEPVARSPAWKIKDRIEALRHWFRYNGDPAEQRSQPVLAAEVPAEYRLVEGIAWDAKTRRLFIATVIDGRLAWRGEDGGWHEIPVGSPRAGLFGMAIDPKRRLLWIATGSVEQTAVAGERMTGVIAVDLEALKVVRRVPVGPGTPGSVGDVTVAADGTVYASNSVSGAIHRCRPGCTALEDFQPAGTYKNPQGMVVSLDGRALYVADYSTGLWVADLRSGARKPIATAGPEMLDGIDGLFRLPGHDQIVAIQNGTRPRRIVRIFPATRKGATVDVRMVVAPDGSEPTLGTAIDGLHMLFVADGQWERYGPEGILTDGKPSRPTPIHDIFAADIIY